MTANELQYCMMRAKEEAHRALRSNVPEVAAAHRRMSVRYSARAFMLRAENEEKGSDSIQMIRPELRA